MEKHVKYLPKFLTSKNDDVPLVPGTGLSKIIQKKTVIPLTENSHDSADEFDIAPKRGGRGRARPIIEDDSDASLASPAKTLPTIRVGLEDSQSGQGCYSGIENSQEALVAVPTKKELTTADITGPPVHQLCYPSCTGCTCVLVGPHQQSLQKVANFLKQ